LNPPRRYDIFSQENDAVSDEKTKKEELNRKYRSKGCQTLSFAEYEALRAKKSGKKRADLPAHFKVVLSTPLLIIFCFGVLFIPYIIYLVITGPYVEVKEQQDGHNNVSYENPFIKKNVSP